MLSSPRFLYRSELGTPQPDGTRALTNLRHLQELLLALETETGCGPAELLPRFAVGDRVVIVTGEGLQIASIRHSPVS